LLSCRESLWSLTTTFHRLSFVAPSSFRLLPRCQSAGNCAGARAGDDRRTALCRNGSAATALQSGPVRSMASRGAWPSVVVVVVVALLLLLLLLLLRLLRCCCGGGGGCCLAVAGMSLHLSTHIVHSGLHPPSLMLLRLPLLPLPALPLPLSLDTPPLAPRRPPPPPPPRGAACMQLRPHRLRPLERDP
jgi:hypothetical protein